MIFKAAISSSFWAKTTYYMTALVLVYLIRNASRLKRLASPFSIGKPTFHQCRESITIFSTCGLGLTQSHKFMYPDPPSTHNKPKEYPQQQESSGCRSQTVIPYKRGNFCFMTKQCSAFLRRPARRPPLLLILLLLLLLLLLLPLLLLLVEVLIVRAGSARLRFAQAPRVMRVCVSRGFRACCSAWVPRASSHINFFKKLIYYDEYYYYFY